MKPSRVIIYARVSTEDQAEDGVSLADQERRLRAYAEACGLTVVAVEVDRGISAKTLDRPAMQRALAALREGRADSVVVTNLDRLTRSVRDLCDLVETYFKDKWSLISLGESLDTRTAGGRMVVHMLGVMAQWQREVGVEKTKSALQHKKSVSERIGSVPVGKRVEDDGRRSKTGNLPVRLVDDHAELAALDVARQMRKSGATLRQIQAAMVERGVRGRRGEKLSLTTLSRIVG